MSEQTCPAVVGRLETPVRQHTPGPWMAHGPAKPTPDAPEGGDYCIQDGGTNVIGEAFYRVSAGVGGTRNAKANARLMAAAPDMLETLEKINEWCCYASEEDTSARLMALQQIGVLARDAIASAA